MKLPIEHIANTNPPRFRWRHDVGGRAVECEGTVPPPLEGALCDLVALAQAAAVLEEERAKLQAFKNWVHDYLDKHGVPADPGGPHTAEGCRIGDRMDWVFEQLASAPAPKTQARGRK